MTRRPRPDRAHGAGAGAETRVELPAGAPAVRRARRVVSGTLHAWGFHDRAWLDDAALVVTELVTNAVRHAGGCRAVILRVDGDRVAIAAVDGSPARPHHRRPRDGGGCGLAVVEALSAGWWVDGGPDGKSVWVRLTPYGLGGG